MSKRRWITAFAAVVVSAQALAAGPPSRILVNGNVITMADALDRMKNAAAERGAGKWVIVAGSWSPAQLAENRAPTVVDLNRILPDNPRYVQYLYDYAIVN